MHKKRIGRVTFHIVTAGALLAIAAIQAWPAETYPAKPIRLLVGFPPAGANDLVARVVAARLGQRLNQQMVVENRPGATGIIATELVARETADGGAGSARLDAWMRPGSGL